MRKMFKFEPPADSADDVPVHLAGMTLELVRKIETEESVLLKIVTDPTGKPVTQEWLDKEFGKNSTPDFWAYEDELTPL